MIGIIVAMPVEAKRVKNDIKINYTKTISNVEFVVGDLYGKEVCLATSGIGKVLAAITTEAMILNFKPDFIISTGVAGGLDKDINVLDISIADKLVQYDMDTTAFGDPLGFISGINKVYFESDKELVDKIVEVAKNNNIKYKIGLQASGDTFVDKEKGEMILKNFTPISCEMESASICLVCYANNVKFVAFRAISDHIHNNVGDKSKNYKENLENACNISYLILKEFIKIA